MTNAEQLQLWVEGKPVHNNDLCFNVTDAQGRVVRSVPVEGGECCPDFSCCNPELLAPLEERQHFLASDQRERSIMCGVFLGRMLRSAGHKVTTSADVLEDEEVPDV